MDFSQAILIQKNPNYYGCKGKNQPGHYSTQHPIYKFSVLRQDIFEFPQSIIDPSKLTRAKFIDSLGALQNLYQNSPFRQSELQISTELQLETSNSQSLYKQTSLTGRIKVHSISPQSLREEASLEDESRVVFDFESQQEALVTSMDEYHDKFVQLCAESDQENSQWMFQSMDALKAIISLEQDYPSQQGQQRTFVGNRLFLDGTASKAKLQLYEQEIKSISTKTSHHTFQDQVQSYVSPLLRKITIFEKPKEKSQIESIIIKNSIYSSGYPSAPTIEYSKNSSSIFVTEKNHIMIDLLSSQVLSDISLYSISQISCGLEFIAALSTYGKVLTWGYGGSGCLGHGDTKSHLRPTIINSLYYVFVQNLQCGSYHTAAVTSNGELYLWGRGDLYQLGHPLSQLSKDALGYVALDPVKLESAQSIQSVACGEAHTLFSTREGGVFSFGWGEQGQLGLPSSDVSLAGNSLPVQLFLPKVAKISAGALFSACVTSEGQVMVWGNGKEGQLGLGPKVVHSELPACVNSLRQQRILEISCGESHCLVYCESGKAYGWGKGIVGCLENEAYAKGSSVICFVPQEIFYSDCIQRMLISQMAFYMILKLFQLLDREKRKLLIFGLVLGILGVSNKIFLRYWQKIRKIYLDSFKKASTQAIQSQNLYYQQLGRTFTVWSMVNLHSVKKLRKQLTKKELDLIEKSQVLSQLKLEAFTQVYYNLYASEVFKMSFLICSHITGRDKRQAGDFTVIGSEFKQLMEEVHGNQDAISFFRERIRPVIEEFQINYLTREAQAKLIMKRIKNRLEIIRRKPNPIFEVSVRCLPDWALKNPETSQFIYYFTLQRIFRKRTQYELKKRWDFLKNRLEEEILKVIQKEESFSEPGQNRIQGVQVGKLIPVVEKLNIHSVWEPFPWLAYKVFYQR